MAKNEIDKSEVLPVRLANRCLVDGTVREKGELVYIDRSIAEFFGKIEKGSTADNAAAVPADPQQ